MAYKYNEPAYYGDMDYPEWLKPSVKPTPTPSPSPDPDPDPDPTPTPIPGEITEIDFSKIDVKNAPWLKKQTLDAVLSDIVSSPKTLNQTIDKLNELVEKLKDCATAQMA